MTPMTLMFKLLTGHEAKQSNHIVTHWVWLPILNPTDWFHHAIVIVLKPEDTMFENVGGTRGGIISE